MRLLLLPEGEVPDGQGDEGDDDDGDHDEDDAGGYEVVTNKPPPSSVGTVE